MAKQVDPGQGAAGAEPRDGARPWPDHRAAASEAAARERARIARGLHDQVGPLLALARMRVAELVAVEKGEAPPFAGRVASLEAVRGNIDEALRAIRSMTFDLHSPSIGASGLDATLAVLGRQLVEPCGIRFAFETDGFPKPMSRARAALVCRVVRELLVNAVKHSRAANTRVTSVRIGRGTRVTVADDGIGFDSRSLLRTSTTSTSYGLKSVAGDVRRLGGRIGIDAAPERGTRVVLDVPLGTKPAARAASPPEGPR